MDKQFAKYMKFGKTVENEQTGSVYMLIECMDGVKDTVKAVNMDNWSRYKRLKAWMQNWEKDDGFRERFTGDIEECMVEKLEYEENINISDVIPHDTIRFITSNYQTKFEVKDLTIISVDGKPARVVFWDEYHFSFADEINLNFYGGCLHICQFAEICEKNGIAVCPI